MSDISQSKRPWSLYVLGLWVLALLYFLCYHSVWRQTGYHAVIGWDVFGYYLYLPASFIYHDLSHLGFLPGLMEKYHPSSYVYAAYPLGNGNFYMSYTMGMSILYLPFFLLGHLVAKLSHYPTDGLSLPYQLAIYVCGAFYSFLGLITIRKVLLRFMNEITVATILFLLIFATNYFHYSLLENGMQHIYLFFLYATLLWLTIRWHEDHLMKHMVAMGFTMGLMVLMRPTEIIAVLIPALWQVTSIVELQGRIRLFLSQWKQLAIGITCAALVGLPQIIYWKAATGHFFFYSYGNIGFDFRHPHIVEGLFSLRKGWLIYTPIMVFALTGLIPLYRQYRKQFWPILIFVVLDVYIVYSWSIWWYGGSFGARAMIQSYALLLLPLGAWIGYVNQKRICQVIFYLFAAFCVFLNLFQDWQYRKEMFSSEGMTSYVYKLIFLQPKVDHALLQSYDTHEQLPGNANFKHSVLFTQTIWPEHSVSEPKYDDTSVLSLDHADNHIIYSIPVSQLPLSKSSTGEWITVSAAAYFKDYEWSYKNMAELGVSFTDSKGKIISKEQIKIQHLTANDSIGECNDLFGKPNKWGRVHVDIQIPPGISPSDTLKVFMGNPGWNTVFVDDLKVELLL